MESTDSTGAEDGVDMAPAAAGSIAAGVGVVAAAVAAGVTGAVELNLLAGSWLMILIDGLAALRASVLLAICEAWYAVEVENYEAVRWRAGYKVKIDEPICEKAPPGTSGQCQWHSWTSADLVRVSWLWIARMRPQGVGNILEDRGA